MIYYYGLKDQDMYMATYPEGAWEEIDNEYGNDCIGMEIYEMKVSRKYGERYCPLRDEYTDHDTCGKDKCEDYKPRNGINGICRELTYSLHETGRKWKILPDGVLKKIAGRLKK